MDSKNQKLLNYQNALNRLKEAVAAYKEENSGDVVRDGMIQRFEFTYELAWKTTKAYLEDIGLADRNNPKAVIKEAYVQKIISNEETWIQMLRDRNMTSHVYQEEVAAEIAERIANMYVREFESLLMRLQ